MESTKQKTKSIHYQFNVNEIARKIEAPILKSISTLNKEMDQRVKNNRKQLRSHKKRPYLSMNFKIMNL